MLSTMVLVYVGLLIVLVTWSGHGQIQGPPGVQREIKAPSTTPGPDKEICDSCQWTSPEGAHYDLSFLCDHKYSIFMEKPRGARLVFGVCDEVSCEGYTQSHTCLYLHGNKATSTGQKGTFELIDPHVPSVGVRLTLGDGEICSLTGKPRKTIIDFQCQPTLSRHSSDPAPSRAWEGEGSDVCTYFIHFPTFWSCPTKKDKFGLPAPKVSSVSGCVDSVPRLSTSECSPSGDTLLTVHGLDFLFDGRPLGAVHVYVGDQPCDQPKVHDTWTLSCRLRPSTGESHPVRIVFWPNLQPGGEPIFKEELYATNPLATVSYKLLVNYKRHFDSFMDLGVGGLTKQIQELYQRAFASRGVPAGVLKELGIDHAKGILLYGPPGSGKTLLARTIAKILKTDQVRMVNAPEIMSKYLGESEKNLRVHFDEAERAWLEYGEASDLHIIIIDEIDAICKPRGKSDTSAAAAAYDSVVNQLLTKMDGLKSLHNVLVIGLTNRRELIDPALLRPGRFEIQIEIGLPDERGRWEILTIHTRSMQDSGYLADDVNIEELAQNTSQYSGAELAGLVRLAASYALDRKFGNNSKLRDPLLIRVADFQHALQQIEPAHTRREETVLSEFLPRGFLKCGQAHELIVARIEQIIGLMPSSRYTRMESILLYGPHGVGKTGIAAYIASSGKFSLVKVITPQALVRMGDDAKAEAIIDVFHDAFRSPLSLVLLDDLHNLGGVVSIAGQIQASQLILNTLSTLLSSQPQPDSRVLVLGTLFTTDPQLEVSYTGAVGIQDMFSSHLYVPNLGVPGALAALSDLKIKRPAGQMLLLPPNFSIPLKNLLKVSSCVEHKLKSSQASQTHPTQEAMDLCLKLVPHLETVTVRV